MFHPHKFLGVIIDSNNPPEFVAHTVAHLASLGALSGIIMHNLPVFYGVFPAAYYAALFIGTPAVQKWIRKRRGKRKGYLTGHKDTQHSRKR